MKIVKALVVVVILALLGLLGWQIAEKVKEAGSKKGGGRRAPVGDGVC